MKITSSQVAAAAALFAVAATMRAPISVLGPLLPTIRDDLALSATQASLVAGVALACFAFGAFGVLSVSPVERERGSSRHRR